MHDALGHQNVEELPGNRIPSPSQLLARKLCVIVVVPHITFHGPDSVLNPNTWTFQHGRDT